MKIRHQGLGKSQMGDRLRTEEKILDFLYVEQPAYLNQIVRGLGIKNKHSVMSGLEHLLGKKEVKKVPNPSGPQRNHFYALQRYRSRLPPNEIEKERRLWKLSYTNHKKFLVLRKREFLESILEELKSGIINPEFFKNPEVIGNAELKTEILRILKRGVEKHGVAFFALKVMIAYSETILTKRQACKIFKISTEAYDANIKLYPELQRFRKNIREEIEKARKINAKVIPQWRSNKLMICTVKNSVAKKYGLI